MSTPPEPLTLTYVFEGAAALMTAASGALKTIAPPDKSTKWSILGTFVASPIVDYDILHLRTFAGDLSAKGERVTTRFLRNRFTVADRRVSRELGLRPRARVFALERLRLVGGRPMSFQVSYLPAAIGEEVAKADLAVTPLRQALSFKLGIEITAARETVSAVPLENSAARDLGCRSGIPAFRSDRVSVGPDGSPVVYDRVFIPGDRFRITRQLDYNGSQIKEPSV